MPQHRRMQIHITCVDDDYYSAGVVGTDRETRTRLLAFLDRYDHEGSGVTLDVFDQTGRGSATFNETRVEDSERVYRILRGEEPVP